MRSAKEVRCVWLYAHKHTLALSLLALVDSKTVRQQRGDSVRMIVHMEHGLYESLWKFKWYVQICIELRMDLNMPQNDA